MANDYETALRIANKRHDVIAVAVTDPREETLPDVGLVNVRDAETGREAMVNTSDSNIRSLYELKARIRSDARALIFRRNRVDSIDVRTDTPYITEIHRFFKMRAGRHG